MNVKNMKEALLKVGKTFKKPNDLRSFRLILQDELGLTEEEFCSFTGYTVFHFQVWEDQDFGYDLDTRALFMVRLWSVLETPFFSGLSKLDKVYALQHINVLDSQGVCFSLIDFIKDKPMNEAKEYFYKIDQSISSFLQ